MVERIQIDGLEIIGYADSLTEDMVPAIVPPVFRSKHSPDRVFVPPYHMNREFLYDSTEISKRELRDLAEARKVTLFDQPLADAKVDHELWLDLSHAPRYEPISKAAETLRQMANEYISWAESAFQSGNLEEAERLSGIAAAADDQRLEPYAIQAAIDLSNHDVAGARLMSDIAATIRGGHAYQLLVDQYFSRICPAPPRPMHNAALARAA